ncbi:MAG: hypothetical protein WCV67_11025 [Victivallaceae bacterium]
MHMRIVAFLAAFVLIAVNIIAGENLIRNGDFKTYTPQLHPEYWVLGWAKPPGGWVADTGVSISAPASLKITNQSGQDTIIVQDAALEPETDYHFSIWMKGDRITAEKAWGGARFYIQDGPKIFRDGSPAGLFKPGTGNFDWGKIEFNFNSRDVKSGKVTIYLALRGASGTVWYDDIVLEKITAAKDTAISGRLFPVDFQNQSYSVCEGLPGILFLDINGDRAQVEKNGLELTLDLPPEFEFKGACTGLLNGKDGQGNFAFIPEKYSESAIQKNGIEYRRYVIAIHDTIIRRMQIRGYAWSNYDRIFIAARPGSAGETRDVFWSLRSGELRGKENQFKLTALPYPEKPAKKVDRFGLMMSFLLSQSAPFTDINDAYLSYWKSLSVAPRTLQPGQWNDYSDAMRSRIENNFKLSIIMASRTATPSIWGAELNTDRIPLLIDDKGKPVKGAVEPYYLAEDPEGLIWDKYFSEAFNARLKKISRPEMIIYDCEPGAMEHGYSAENRKRFAAYAKLEHIPEIAEIKSQYTGKWFDFRVYQHGLIIKKFCDAVHKHFPGVKAVICSDPVHAGSQPLANWCGVDVRLSDNDVDLHMNMPYYSGLEFYNDVELNNKILKKKNFPLIDPTENEDRFYKRYSPLEVKQNIVAAAALGCSGIGFWPSDAFDGRYFRTIAEAFNLVGQAEDFYFSTRCDNKLSAEPANVFAQTFEDDGQKHQVKLPDFNNTVKTLMHEKDDAFIVTVLNYNPDSVCLLRLAIPTINDGPFQVKDLGSGRYFSVSSGNDGLTGAQIRAGFLVEIPPREVVLLQITPGTAKTPSAQIILQSELDAKLAAAKEQLSKMTKFESIARNNAAVSWSVLPGADGTPKLKLQLDKFKIYIDPARGADITGWKNTADAARDYLFHQNRGVLGQLSFYDTKQRSAPFPFELKNIGISEAGNPFALCSYTVPGYEGANSEANPLEGLIISKEISLSDNGKTINTTLKFTNRGPRRTEMKLGFRIKNYPRLGGSLAGMKTLADIATVKYSSPSGEKNVPSDRQGGILLLSEKNAGLSFLKGVIKPDPWLPGPVIAEAAAGPLKETLVFDAAPEFTAGYLIWRTVNDYTVEMLSSEFILPFGKTAEYTYTVSLK